MALIREIPFVFLKVAQNHETEPKWVQIACFGNFWTYLGQSKIRGQLFVENPGLTPYPFPLSRVGVLHLCALN
jgi:hypothetical protein